METSKCLLYVLRLSVVEKVVRASEVVNEAVFDLTVISSCMLADVNELRSRGIVVHSSPLL